LNAPQTGTAPAPKGQETAAAALALLTRSGKGGKTPGKTGPASALEAGTKKSGTAFLDLVKAKTTGAAGLTGPDLGAALKSAARKAGAPGAAAEAAPQGVAQSAQAGLPAQAAQAAKSDAKDEKAAVSKKKLLAGLDANALAAAALAPLEGGKQQAHPAPGGDTSSDVKSVNASTRSAAQAAAPVIRIVDLRSKPRAAAGDDAAAAKAVAQVAAGDRDSASSGIVQKASFGSSAPAADKATAPAAAAPAAGETPLDRLREMAGTELIRASSLVLRDGGGEIRLVLKPESLGSVRIRMNVVDNAIEGRIVVDSSAVKQVMDANMDALRRALTAEGFQMGSLQVSVGGQNTDANQQREQEAPEAVRRVTAQGFDHNVPGVETMSLGDLFVNLFV